MAEIKISPYNSARIDSGPGNHPRLYRPVIRTTNAGNCADTLPAVQAGDVRLSMRACHALSRSRAAASDAFPDPESPQHWNAARSLSRTGARCLHRAPH